MQCLKLNQNDIDYLIYVKTKVSKSDNQSDNTFSSDLKSFDHKTIKYLKI